MDLTMKNDRDSVKKEPSDPDDQGVSYEISPEEQLNSVGHGEVWIKEEPKSEDDDIPDSLNSEDQGTNNKEHILVKIEPINSVSEDNSRPLKLRRSLRGQPIPEEYFEYLPINKRVHKKKTVKDEENLKRTFKSKPRKQSIVIYSEEVTEKIEVITITEEERQVEHSELLNSRKHMPHMCENCAIGFVVKDAYLMHMKIHSPENGEYECDICHAHIKTPHNLYHHKLRHYRRYRCILCDNHPPFKDKDSAACHVMKEHTGTAFTCKYCGRNGFKRPQYLKRHIEQYHTKPLELKCPHCERVFHERGWYRVHVRTHLEEVRTCKTPASCPVCSRHFASKANMKRHLQTHDHELADCHVCGKRCATRDALRQHYWEEHNMTFLGPREQMCPHCTRVCVTKAMLKRHIQRMHSDRTKRFQCDHCQRMYMTKGEVRAHITWSHLPAHVRAKHACACGRVFRTPSLLREHTLRAHQHTLPPRNHRCDLCGKAFMGKQVLNRHMKSHSNEMYPCDECGLLFKTQPYVKIHYKIKHLNMTRAEIRAQSRRKPSNNIIKSNNKPNGSKKTKKQSQGSKLNGTIVEPNIPALQSSSDVDPLSVQVNDIQIKIEHDEGSNVNIPLFQTFIDVRRD